MSHFCNDKMLGGIQQLKRNPFLRSQLKLTAQHSILAKLDVILFANSIRVQSSSMAQLLSMIKHPICYSLTNTHFDNDLLVYITQKIINKCKIIIIFSYNFLT